MKFMKLGSKLDSFRTDGNNVRFVASELPTDITITVGDTKFYLHKFPLLSKSAQLQKVVAVIKNEDNDEIDISAIPGGAAAFEVCAKFCYGMTVTLNAYNVVAVRCAAEYLEMNETIDKGNLIYKIEVFLKSSIFRSWKDSIIVLKHMNSFLSTMEDLKLVNQCIDCIASKASIDTTEVEWSYTYDREKLASENGLDNGIRKPQSVPKDWWMEDLCELEIDFYKRVMTAIKSKDQMPGKVIGEALKAYINRRLPGFCKGTLKIHEDDIKKYCKLLEIIIWLLPEEKSSVSCSFLLRLLRAANLLGCSEEVKKELVKRAGLELEEASVNDLLIPAPEGENTIYDIDIIVSIVEEFMVQECSNIDTEITDELRETKTLCSVAKLVDGYLAEAAKDPNLPISKFVDLAELVPVDSRPVHDGLYRAIDMYLKEHPKITKTERKRICGLMDCKKLSVDACMHAVQNERLPLRVVVQILFFEQVKAAATGGGAHIRGNTGFLLPRDQKNVGSCGSSRSAATENAEEVWDSIPRGEDLKALKSLKLVNGGVGSESSASSEANRNGDEKGKVMIPRKILGKFWSSKRHAGENSSSDTSESPNSTNQDELKSASSRNMRHSVS